METIRINFGGFYETIHDRILETEVAYYFDMVDDIGDVDSEKTWYIGADVWHHARLQYSKEYIYTFNSIFGTDLKFISLDRPNYYNFSTDVIIANITRKDTLMLIKALKMDKARLKERLFHHIKNKTRSRDGFIAYYSYDEVFKKENRGILISYIIDILLEREEENYTVCCDDFYITSLPDTVTNDKGYISLKEGEK